MSELDMRPRLAFRVGVTGARHIAPEQMTGLRGQVDDVLRFVHAALVRIAANDRAKLVYAGETPMLSIISPLAEGADRMVAEAAIGLGFDLVAPLPFTQADYENDFPETLDAFRRLLAGAAVIELDGARGAAEAPSYEAVGRFVVRNCDLVVALWDGQPARGQGGTGDIVRFAVRAGVPVWWIDIATAAPRFMATPAHWREREDATASNPQAALGAYLTEILLPPIVEQPERHGIVGHAVDVYCRTVDFDPHPLDRFFNEPVPLPSKGVWRAFDRFYRVIAPPGEAVATAPPDADAEEYWLSRYRYADGLSVAYGNRYRSSYVLIIVLALGAFCLSVLGGAFHGGRIGVGLELAALFCIGALVWQNHLYGWQERWIAYRLLAELCRKQIMLSFLGHTFSMEEIRAVMAEPADGTNAVLPREAWIGWSYAAAVRAAPVPQRSTAAAKQRALDIARHLVGEQRAYHRVRARRAERADRRLGRYSEAFFAVTVVGLTVAFGFLLAKGQFGAARGIEIAATLFSGLSAAFVGLRAYAEFALLAQESQRMQKVMRDMASELESIDLDAPLASGDLGVSLQRLARAMMQDVRGWAQLFRLKTVEAS